MPLHVIIIMRASIHVHLRVHRGTLQLSSCSDDKDNKGDIFLAHILCPLWKKCELSLHFFFAVLTSSKKQWCESFCQFGAFKCTQNRPLVYSSLFKPELLHSLCLLHAISPSSFHYWLSQSPFYLLTTHYQQQTAQHELCGKVDSFTHTCM